MSDGALHAVVTPYCTEDASVIARCIASVKRQSAPAVHFLVSDGRAQNWIDRERVRHVKLGRTHGDYGNAARGVGGLLAAAEGFRCIAFLDADNWYEPDHLEQCMEAAAGCPAADCDYVVARRRWMRPDESFIDAPDEPVERHVDTNCLVLLPGSHHLISLWASMPRQLSAIGDRIFYAALRSRGLRSAVVPRATVNYLCLWEYVYRQKGEAPPPGAKPVIDTSPIADWLRSLSPRELEIASRLSGVRLERPAT